MKISSLTASAALLALSTFAAPSLMAAPDAKKAPAAVGKENADQLLTNAEKALAAVVKSARADQQLAGKVTAKPFFASLKKIDGALEQARKGLAAKDKSFFTALDAARAGVAEMQVTWPLAKSDSKDVIADATKLSGAVTALQMNYNPLAQRAKQGGKLTAEETTRFKKLQAQQLDLAKQASLLAKKLKGNPALVSGLNEISSRARKAAKAPATPSAFASAVDLLATLAGLFAGYDYYVPAKERTAWTKLRNTSKAVAAPVAYYEFITYDWATTSVPVDIYESYDVSITSEEMTTEESYLEESSFEATEEEEESIAEESDEISDDADDDLESEQEDVADDEEDEAFDDDDDSGDDDSGDDDSGDDDSGDDDSGDDDSGDDDSGDDDSGDDDSGDDDSGDDDSGDDDSGDDDSGDDDSGDDDSGGDDGGDDSGGDDGGGDE